MLLYPSIEVDNVKHLDPQLVSKISKCHSLTDFEKSLHEATHLSLKPCHFFFQVSQQIGLPEKSKVLVKMGFVYYAY